MSRCLCVGCLETFARRLYRPPLRFEVEERSNETGSVTFVDKELLATWDKLVIVRKDVNKKFMVGLEDKPQKIRYPQFLGPGFLRPKKMKSCMRAVMYAELATE